MVAIELGPGGFTLQPSNPKDVICRYIPCLDLICVSPPGHHDFATKLGPPESSSCFVDFPCQITIEGGFRLFFEAVERR